MNKSEPHRHHYAPQFFLRGFAVDEEHRKIATVAKHNRHAIWSIRSIDSLAYEEDFYVHLQNGQPVSVETVINRQVETPLTGTETWRKIAEGRTADLDRSDRAILYALIRHLHARTPHAQNTAMELAEMAASENSTIAFSDEEREMYAALRADPQLAKAFFNTMSSHLSWTKSDFEGCGILVCRSTIPLRCSTTPVLTISSPSHPGMSLPLLGMVPYALLLTLRPDTLVILVLGDFDSLFQNRLLSEDESRAFNRIYLGQFAHFETMRHLITPRDGLIEDMTWAPYDFVSQDARKVAFLRRVEADS